MRGNSRKRSMPSVRITEWPVRPKTNTSRRGNVLNTLFIIGALAGLIVYFCASHNGIIVILVAMVFKRLLSAASV